MVAKHVFVILGVARSGTSAIARGLKALGVDFGSQLTTSNKWNPTGFWEDHGVLNEVNGKVLAAMGSKIHDFKLIDQHVLASDVLQDIRGSAVTLLQERFAATQYWAFKDPSTSRILSFWQTIFAAQQIQEHYVVTLRNPLSSAQSYKDLTGAALEAGLLLWLVHVLPAIEGTRGKNRVVVSFDLLMQDPMLQLERMKNQLSIPLIANAAELENYVQDFLDKKLRHYEFNDADLVTHPAIAVVPLCAQAYFLLMKLASDELSQESDAFVTAWGEIKKEFIRLYPAYCYLETLMGENKQLMKRVRMVEKSFLWKVVYPLRKAGDVFRYYRKKVKAVRKIKNTLAV